VREGQLITPKLVEISEEPFKIEDDIPIPSKNPIAIGYPFDRMKVGQSFFAPGKKPGHFGHHMVRQKGLGRQFTARLVEGGTRIWRVK
jgi:hypothetical protein